MYGSVDLIKRFFKANDWIGKRLYFEDMRYDAPGHPFSFKVILEKFLGGFLGDNLEKIVKRIQFRKFENSYANLRKTIRYESRLIFHDNELELHPDTERFADWLRISGV
jgi:hypothetical protein